MKLLSAVIIAKNEENSIVRCLDSIDFCDEIILVDDYSTDQTALIAKKKGVKVYQRKLEDDFSAQRNFGMEQAKGTWILFIDADEIIPPELKKEIQDTLRVAKWNVYYIKRREWFWGRELKFGEVQKARERGFIRLIKSQSGLWQGKVHEEFQTAFVFGTLKNSLIHEPHRDIEAFIRKINFYSSLRGRELYKQGQKMNPGSLIFFPLFKFVYTFFLKMGFMDGEAGFVYSFLMSFHSFLVRAKLYQYDR